MLQWGLLRVDAMEYQSITPMFSHNNHFLRKKSHLYNNNITFFIIFVDYIVNNAMFNRWFH